MGEFITINESNISKEHICCAFSDKKCKESYEMKKSWLKEAFKNGYVFRRLDERAKVFIEYAPAEYGWVPVSAPNYLIINCFWVSGKYKSHGYGKALLQSAWDDAVKSGKDGLVTVAGTNKFHFMSDAKWLLKQGFEVAEKLPNGFSLLVKKIKKDAKTPSFAKSVQSGECENKKGLTVYYSNRCPFTEFHINNSLKETAEKRKLPLRIIKLETLEEAMNAPTPATIFSLFYDGKFVTTDVSVCVDSRFDKIINQLKMNN